jgi:outer membrane lipoprotein carrier protein
MTSKIQPRLVWLVKAAFALLLVGNTAFAVDQTEIVQSKKDPSVLQLIKLLSATDGMIAKFHQEAVNASGEALQQTRGTMKLQRPGKFYWHTQEPFEQKINSDGKRVWIYDIDLEQVSIQNVDPGLGQTPAALLSGEPDEVVHQFYVEGTQRAAGNWHFNLRPKEESSLFSGVELQFSGKKLVYMKLKDSLNQTTTVRFADVKLNPNFKHQAFMLEFPEGVDIIDSTQGKP